jgi:hypothetical protein
MAHFMHLRRSASVLDDDEWVGRCCSQLILRDAELNDAEAQLLAEDMNNDSAWRKMAPEEAADAMFRR